MQSYLGNATLKKKFVAEIKKHQEADAIKTGAWDESAARSAARSARSARSAEYTLYADKLIELLKTA
jgi:hypothetical protein